jgi:hypothetical protein
MAAAILALIDGRRAVGEIEAALVARGASREVFAREWRMTFASFEHANRLFLTALP